MNSFRGFVAAALMTSVCVQPVGAQQDELDRAKIGEVQNKMRTEFAGWIATDSNIKSDYKLKIPSEIDLKSGVLEFSSATSAVPTWVFKLPDVSLGERKATTLAALQGMFNDYTGKSVGQALSPIDGEDQQKRILKDIQEKATVRIDDKQAGSGSSPQTTPSLQTFASPQTLASPQSWIPVSTTSATAPLRVVATRSNPGTSGLAVSRGELLKGKVAADWERLFNAGYGEFRSGRFEEAAEYFAASSEVGDDPRAWNFLALSLLMKSDSASAQDAARYAAALTYTRPSYAEKVGMSLLDVNGPLRDRLWEMQKGINQPRVARLVLSARPNLNGAPTLGVNSRDGVASH